MNPRVKRVSRREWSIALNVSEKTINMCRRKILLKHCHLNKCSFPHIDGSKNFHLWITKETFSLPGRMFYLLLYIQYLVSHKSQLCPTLRFTYIVGQSWNALLYLFKLQSFFSDYCDIVLVYTSLYIKAPNEWPFPVRLSLTTIINSIVLG